MMPFIRFGHYLIPSFFLIISLGLTALLFFLSFRVNLFNKDRKIAFNIVLVLMISGFTGGRLLHILYEEPAYYFENPWKAFAFWNGGFVFFGGLILSWLAVCVYCRFKKINFWEWADFYAPILSLGHAIGRVGCMLAGCCFGTYCTLPWAIDGRHPAPIYLLIAELVVFIVLISLEFIQRKKNVFLPSGIIFLIWLLLHSTVRFFVEYIRDDFRGSFWNIPYLGELSISQLISLVLILSSMIQIFQITKKSKAAH